MKDAKMFTSVERYCIQQLGTSEDRSFEDINLFWSFAGNESGAGNNFDIPM